MVSKVKKVIKDFAPVKYNPNVAEVNLPNYSGAAHHIRERDQLGTVRYADNYKTIQEAIDSLPSTGGTVMLSAKTYNISSPITISNSFVTLQGEGKASIIRTSAAVNAISISGDDIYYCTLRDFTIDGNSTGNVGVYLDSNATTADEPYFIIENLRIHDMTSHGIHTTNRIQETWISMCRIRDCGGHGMQLDGFDHKILQCVVSECTGEGFNFPSTSSNIKLTQCKAYNNDNGFVVTGDGHFYFTQCQAQENQNRGFLITTGSGSEKMVSLVGCVADGNYLSGTGGAGEGLRITGRNEVHVIGGEYSKSGGAGDQTYGIRITGSSDKCVVIGAELSGNATAQYSDEGSGTNQILACVGHTDDNIADHDLFTTGDINIGTVGGGADRGELQIYGNTSQPGLVFGGFDAGVAKIRTTSGADRTLRLENTNGSFNLDLEVEGDITGEGAATITGEVSSNAYNITNTDGANGQGLEWNQTISTTASQIDFLRWAGSVSKSSTGVLIARGLAFEPSIDMTNVSSMAGATFVNASTYTAPSTSILPSLQVYYDSGTLTSTGGASTSGLYRSFDSNPTFSSSSGGSYTITALSNYRASGSSFSSGNTITTYNGYDFSPTFLFQTGTTWTGVNLNPTLAANTITTYRHIFCSDVTNATNVYGVYSAMNSAANKYFLYGAGTAASYLGGTLQVQGNVGFNGQTPSARQTYTVTNLTTDRSYNANATTVAELADVLGTLIADLRTIGLLA